MENESHKWTINEYVSPCFSLVEVVGDKETEFSCSSPGASLFILQGPDRGRSGRILPAWVEAERRGRLEQVAQDKFPPGLSLEGEKGPETPLIFQHFIGKLVRMGTKLIGIKSLLPVNNYSG